MTESELAGGLHAVALRRAGVPLVELRLVFPLSARQISQPAAPLVMSDSLFAGTDRHDREGLAIAVQRLGGTLTATLRGDNVELSASSLANRLPALLALVAEVLTAATYPAPEVHADRARKADEVAVTLSLPETLADEALAKRLFGSHPYGTAIPRPEAVLRVGAASLRKLHGGVLTPKSAHLTLVGDIQPKRTLAVAEDALGRWLSEHGARVSALPPLPDVLPGPLRFVDRSGSVQSNLRLGGAAPDRARPDWPAAALANEILGGMFTSRLVENLREKNGYTYSPRSAVDHGRAGSTLSIRAEVSTEVTAAALVETRYELGRIATTGVTEEEVEAARRYAVGSFLFRTATQAGLASALSTWALAGIGPGYLTAYPASIARATRAEVDEAARRYLAPSGIATVVIGDGDALAGQLAILDEVSTV
ncbi:MAG: M16 family metallopeptidase [Acidimicrobiales bacterium]